MARIRPEEYRKDHLSEKKFMEKRIQESPWTQYNGRLCPRKPGRWEGFSARHPILALGMVVFFALAATSAVIGLISTVIYVVSSVSPAHMAPEATAQKPAATGPAATGPATTEPEANGLEVTVRSPAESRAEGERSPLGEAGGDMLYESKHVRVRFRRPARAPQVDGKRRVEGNTPRWKDNRKM